MASNKIINPIKGFGLENSFSNSLEIDLSEIPDSYEEICLKFNLLKTKYKKLYKDHNTLLKTLENDSFESKKLWNYEVLIKSLENKIIHQEQEIKNFRFTVDDLNSQLESKDLSVFNKTRPINNSFSSFSTIDITGPSLDISSDICLINCLVHRLLFKHDISRSELIKYRYALQRIEDKFTQLSSKYS